MDDLIFYPEDFDVNPKSGRFAQKHPLFFRQTSDRRSSPAIRGAARIRAKEKQHSAGPFRSGDTGSPRLKNQYAPLRAVYAPDRETTAVFFSKQERMMTDLVKKRIEAAGKMWYTVFNKFGCYTHMMNGGTSLCVK